MMTASSCRWGAGFALAALAALTLTGCGGSDKADGKPSPQRPTAAPSSGRPSSAPPPSPSPSPSAAATAANGSDVAACADGNCEITVSAPVTFRFKGPAGPATLSVTEVGPNKVEYTVKSANGRSAGGATGRGQGCITVLRSNGSGNSCGGLAEGTRPRPQPHAVVIQAATGEDGTAILHLVSG